MKMARAFHADARARAEKLDISFCELAYEFGVQECVNDRGQTYYAPTFTFVGSVGDPEGPTETEVIRAGPCAISSRRPSMRRSGRPRTAEAQSCRPATLRQSRLSPAAPERSGSSRAPPPVNGPEIDDDIPF